MKNELENWTREELINAVRRADAQRPWGALHHNVGTPDYHGGAPGIEPSEDDQRESQRMLEESRTRYADLYDLAPVAYCTLDRRGRILESNLEAASLFGWPRAELIGEPLSSVVTITEETRFQDHLARCFGTATRGRVELTFATWRGRIAVDMISVPVVEADGEVTSCKTTLTDVTGLKASEQRLRMLSETSEALVSSLDYTATLAIVARRLVPALADVAFIDVLEDDGHIARYAPTHSRTITTDGNTPQAAVMESGQPALHPTCSGATIALALSDGIHSLPSCRDGSLLMAPLVARERTLGVLTCIMTGSGRYHSAADLALAQQVASRAAMAIDNARLYLSARRAIRVREDVAAIVSHDLRNPLQGIRLHCEQLLVTHEPKGDFVVRHVEAIQRGVRSMQRLISDLLDMSRIEAGQLMIDPSDHDVAGIVADAVNLVRPLADDKGINIEIATSPINGQAHCDRERILQVLSNVLGNALKFTSKGGTITVEIRVDDVQVIFSVRDTGEGIPPEHLPHLFDRYWRANQTSTKGVGLGLYIAKAIVDAHRGDIAVESEVGVGTIVRFSLPHSECDEAALSIGNRVPA